MGGGSSLSLGGVGEFDGARESVGIRMGGRRGGRSNCMRGKQEMLRLPFRTIQRAKRRG